MMGSLRQVHTFHDNRFQMLICCAGLDSLHCHRLCEMKYLAGSFELLASVSTPLNVQGSYGSLSAKHDW